MNRRMGQGEMDALETRLLDAARRERPRAAARQRTAIALAGGAMAGSLVVSSAAGAVADAASSGAGTIAAVSGAGTAGATALGSAKIAASTAAWFGVAKAVALGALSGVVVLGAAKQIHSPEPTRTVSDKAPVGAAIALRPPKPAGGPSIPSKPEEMSSFEVQLPRVEPRRSQDAPSPGLVRQPAPPVDTVENGPSERSSNEGARQASSLVAEVAMLDRAREALLARDPNRTLRVLDGYEDAKTGPRLSSEASLLRIEALLQLGESARAVALAKAFLRDHAESPFADRMRAIVDAASR
jgi:hypothetical protein